MMQRKPRDERSDSHGSDHQQPKCNMNAAAFYRQTELDRTTWPEFRDQVQGFAADEESSTPRTYPGYPHWPLQRCRPRLWPGLEPILWSRRSALSLSANLPSRRELSRVLHFSHGVNASLGRGPTPSAGGLQALELYLVNLADAWLPTGLYHYERADNSLAQLIVGAEREAWLKIVPSLALFQGGSLLWILVGDGARITQKYGERGWRFLLRPI